MGTQDSSQPPETGRPRRRMVLRRIDTGAIVAPSDHAHARGATLPAAADAPRTPPPGRTIRPPRRAEDAEAAAPIPLTRLHTPRASFRSAIDLPSATSRDEPSVRETTGASLPPLVATLPPVAQPIYLPASVTNPRGGRTWLGRTSLHGALAVVATVIVLGGVAVGKRIVSVDDTAPSRSSTAAAASPPSPAAPGAAAQPTRAPAVATVEAVAAPPRASGGEGWTPTASVESLPRVTAGARPIAATPAQHPAPRPAAPPAPSPAAKAAPPGDAVVHGDAKDSPATEQSPSDTAAAPAVAPEAPATVNEDPLVKAVRDDIREEEDRRR